MDRSMIQKLSRNMTKPNQTKEQMDLVDIYRSFYSLDTEDIIYLFLYQYIELSLGLVILLVTKQA